MADPKATFNLKAVTVPAKGTASFTVTIKPPKQLPGALLDLGFSVGFIFFGYYFLKTR